MAVARGSPNNSIGLKRGKQVNTMREAFRLKTTIERTSYRSTMRRAWVKTYHADTQKVDVVPVDDPGTTIFGVPIRRGQSTIKQISPLVGFTNNEPTTLTDIGMLLYADQETGNLIEGRNQPLARHVSARGRPIAPVFWPGDIGYLQHEETFNIDPAVLDALHEDDAAFLFDEMGLIFRKDRGDGKSQIIVFADDIVFMRPGQNVNEIAPIARQGDEGDGMGGSIAGGSSVTRSG